MNLAFTYWMMKRRDARTGWRKRFHDMRVILMLQTRDIKQRGKGNRAWKRADALLRSLERVTVDAQQIARGCV